MRWLLLLLASCGAYENAQTRNSDPPVVPYPDAKGLPPGLATAVSPDSDCFGAIQVQAPYKPGTWGIGPVADGRFQVELVFNTERDARACAGSSSKHQVRHMIWGAWVI